MKIYIANLAKYNQGHLTGKWIDLPADPSELQRVIDDVLGCCDEEYAIHDYEAPFPIYEYSNPFQLNQIAELDECDLERFAYLVELGYDWSYALEHHVDVSCYPDADLMAVADEMLDAGCFGEIPESIRALIDMDKIVNMLDMDGYVETDKGVFFYH